MDAINETSVPPRNINDIFDNDRPVHDYSKKTYSKNKKTVPISTDHDIMHVIEPSPMISPKATDDIFDDDLEDFDFEYSKKANSKKYKVL